MAVLLASAFRGNKISAAAGAFITNPVTAVFIYRMITYPVGRMFVGGPSIPFPHEFNMNALIQVLKSGQDILWILTVGGVITGIPIAAAGYFLCYWWITKRGNKYIRKPLKND
jgi:hypothetical protein